MKKFWPFSFYFLYYAATASFIPFIVLFYQELKFSGAQIGLLTGVPPLITLISAPFLAGIADAKRRHRLIISLGIVIAVVATLIMQWMTSFLIILILVLLVNFFFAPVGSLADSATIAMLGDEKSMYGRIRLGGTIGWGVLAPIAGVLVDNFGLKIAFWSFSILMFFNLLVSQKVVHDESVPEHTVEENQGIRFFLTSRRWITFLLSAFLGGLGVLTVTTYLYPRMAEMGASESMMGIASFIATVTELPIFFFGNRLVKRFTSYRLFVFALAMMGVRSLLFAWVSEPVGILIVQAMGGTIFPAMWLAGVSYADEHAPVGLKSTAQGLLGSMTFGFGSAIGGFIGGILLESVGGRNLFLVFGIITLAGLVLIEGFKRLIPEKAIPQPIS
jgi:PPP family 3-phenylpropionic acid transporter